jgi:hypothetical protein
VTAPTKFGALQAFSCCEPRYDELRPQDGNRPPASYVDRSRRAGADMKLAYLMPSFADPIGQTLLNAS